MASEKELEDEIKKLMLFCRHNQEAKDRLNRIYDLVKQARQDERKKCIEEIKKMKMDDRPEIKIYLISKDYTKGWNDCINEIVKTNQIPKNE